MKKILQKLKRKRQVTQDRFDGARVIKLATDFSKYPMGKTSRDGEYNALRFRDDVFLPALREHKYLILDITGCEIPFYWNKFVFGSLWGFGYAHTDLQERVKIISEHERPGEYLIWEIWDIINETEVKIYG